MDRAEAHVEHEHVQSTPITVQVGSIERDSCSGLFLFTHVGRKPAFAFFGNFQLALCWGCTAAPPANCATRRGRQGGTIVRGEPALVVDKTAAPLPPLPFEGAGRMNKFSALAILVLSTIDPKTFSSFPESSFGTQCHVGHWST